MSGAELWLAAGAIGVVALLARWLKLSESRLDERTAQRFAERGLGGFTAGTALVSPAGRAALVAGEGALALLIRRGPRVEVRRLLPPLVLREIPEGAAIYAGGRIVAPIALHGVTIAQVRAVEAEAAQAYRTRQ